LKPSKNAVLYLVISVLCFVAIIWTLYDFFAARPNAAADVSIGIFSEYDASDLADSALNVKITAPPADFTANPISPFKTFRLVPAAASTGSAAAGAPVKNRRSHLRLKGLMKNPQMAILEDPRGETYIKAQGDYIQNIRITAIEDNSVVLSDSIGTYLLTVEEIR